MPRCPYIVEAHCWRCFQATYTGLAFSKAPEVRSVRHSDGCQYVGLRYSRSTENQPAQSLWGGYWELWGPPRNNASFSTRGVLKLTRRHHSSVETWVVQPELRHQASQTRRTTTTVSSSLVRSAQDRRSPSLWPAPASLRFASFFA